MFSRGRFTIAALGGLCMLEVCLGHGGNLPRQGRRNNGAPSIFHLSVPPHAYDVILNRPEKDSVGLSVLFYQDSEAYVRLGSRSGAYSSQSELVTCKSGVAKEISLTGLKPNSRYYYRLFYRSSSSQAFAPSEEFSFRTARGPGSTFSFTLTADAHLDEHTSAAVYTRTLGGIKALHPDFHLDLGNLFMTDKHQLREEAGKQYISQRYYLGQIGVETPVMLALGTHDGESSRYYGNSDDSLAVWSNLIRKLNFPNPTPDKFYSGDTFLDPKYGDAQDYYAWNWGDALFVVLDPFRYSQAERSRDGWGWSLGKEQYQWLSDTLQSSRSKFKFVFIHNLLSGDQASRGGVEIAGFNEWGGKNLDGSEGFETHRPGWGMPIHQLLLKNQVTAVFKAHDNFFAQQELDGIVYQMVPQPSFAGDDRIRDLGNYGYKKGKFLGNTGFLRVLVSPDRVQIQYSKTKQDLEISKEDVASQVAYSYSILPGGKIVVENNGLQEKAWK